MTTIISALLTIMLLITWQQLFQLDGIVWICVSFIASIVLFSIVPKKWRRYMWLAIAAICVTTGMIILRGLNALWNEMSTYVGQTLGYAWPQYANEGFLYYTLCLLGTVLGGIVYHFTVKKWSWPFTIAIIVMISWQVFTEQIVNSWLLASVIVSWLIWMQTCKPMYVSKKMIYRRIILYSVLFLGLGATMWLPQKQTPLYAKTATLLHNAYYGKNDIDWHTDGNMMSVSQAKTTKRVAMTVMMEEPTALYMRGFVGESYVRNEWHPLTHKQYYDAQPLLQTLQRAHYDSATLLSTAYQQTTEQPVSKMHVYVKDVPTSFSYTPYEIATTSEANGFVHDATNTSNTWQKASDYTYNIAPKARIAYPIIATKQKDEAFLRHESHYNDFVYKHYLSLSKVDQTTLSAHLKQQERTSYSATIKEVQKLLKENMRYEENVKAVPDGQNFLRYTLENTKRGYSPHYATVATLAFRYLGIPARYVEGYVVTKKMVEQKQSYQEIQVTGKEAHAWPEIYIDQLGWVPVEVTPGFDQKMPHLETPKNEAKHSAAAASTSKKQTQIAGEQVGQTEKIGDQTQKIDPAPKTEEQHNVWWNWLLYAIGTCLVTMAFIFWKRRHVRKWRQKLCSTDEVERAEAALMLLQWQFNRVLKIQKPSASLYSWQDVLPDTYKAPMQTFITEYQAIKYGASAQHIESHYEVIQRQLKEHLPRFKRILYYLKGNVM